MAQRSTRNKIRFQSTSALIDLERAQDHLATIAGLADGRSKLVDDDLPLIMASNQMVIEALKAFHEAL